MGNANSFRFDIVDHVMLVVHADMPADDGDWARMIVVRDANRSKMLRRIDAMRAQLGTTVGPPP